MAPNPKYIFYISNIYDSKVKYQIKSKDRVACPKFGHPSELALSW